MIAEGTTELEQPAARLGAQPVVGLAVAKYLLPADPLEILETTKGDWGFGMCTHYGATFAGCASALGWVARVLIVDHHCLAEVWSEQLQKWILEDSGPCREYDATYEIDGVPLNALELHDALLNGQRDKIMSNKLPQNTVDPMDRYMETFCRFGIPLRNNHLTHAEPPNYAMEIGNIITMATCGGLIVLIRLTRNTLYRRRVRPISFPAQAA